MTTVARFRRHAALLGATLLASAAWADPYLVGRGMADITGEAAEVGMMGYASTSQVTAGIHMRQRARAFIVADQASGKRTVFVNNDLGMLFQGVQQAVIKALKAKYGNQYGADNVILAATHTHGGPGGFSHYALYNLTTLGYNKRTYDAIVSGIVLAIDKAHRDLKPGSVQLGKGELTDANNNRSLAAYERNPQSERERWGRPIDPEMTAQVFYHDCSAEDRALAAANLCPEPVAPQETPLALTSRSQSLPRFYIRCTEDQTIPPEYQAMMETSVPSDARYTLTTSHSPFFADPEATAALVAEIHSRLPS